MAAKIRVGDEVILLAGKDKNRSGKVMKILEKSKPFGSETRYIVEGLQMVTVYVKANPQANEAGGVFQKESSIHASNVALKNPHTGRADKVGFKLENGKKVRYYKSTGEVVRNGK